MIQWTIGHLFEVGKLHEMKDVEGKMNDSQEGVSHDMSSAGWNRINELHTKLPLVKPTPS
jgi:hypothetical protein